ncbi:MAG: hypothetical protein MZV70_05895 [Desulfobacterales bacterium]|nr:hypothetical protein [Desulfobacterales bacterium]
MPCLPGRPGRAERRGFLEPRPGAGGHAIRIRGGDFRVTVIPGAGAAGISAGGPSPSDPVS